MKQFINLVINMLFVLAGTLAPWHVLAESDQGDAVSTRWLVVHAGNVLAVPGEKTLGPSTVVIRDDRIVAILDGHEDVTAIDGIDTDDVIDTLDLSEKFVLPGLMDMHVHLSFEFGVEGQRSHGGSNEFALQHRSAKDDVYNFVTAIANARKTLQAGFTTVRNVGSEGWHVFALRDAINDGNLDGPRIFTAGHTIRIGGDDGEGACYSVASCRQAARSQIDMGADLIKVYATCSGSKPCGYEGAPAVFMADELAAIVAVAATREVKVAAHAHGTDGINLAAESGVASIEHGSYNDSESHRLMKRHGVYLVPTLAVQDNIREDIKGADGKMLEVMQAFLDNHGPRMLAAHEAGVKIAAGSDAGVTRHGNNVRELEIYVENGLSAEEAIIAATVNAAELVGVADDLGTLEVGKIADLIAVDGNPIEDIGVLRTVSTVVKDGRLAYTD